MMHVAEFAPTKQELEQREQANKQAMTAVGAASFTFSPWHGGLHLAIKFVEGTAWVDEVSHGLIPGVNHNANPRWYDLGNQPTVDVLRQAKEALERLLPAITDEYQKEKSRLDIEWNSIEKHHHLLIENRRDKGENASSADTKGDDPATEAASYLQKELDKLRRWEESEKKAIASMRAVIDDGRRRAAAERSAAEVAGRAAAEAQKKVEAHARERCPAGLTCTECEYHPEWRRLFMATSRRLEADWIRLRDDEERHRAAASSPGREAGQREAIESRESRLPRALEARRLKIGADVILIEQRAELRQKQQKRSSDAAKAIQERLKMFNEDSNRVEAMGAFIRQANRLLK
jgi:hypothetical protein